MVTVDQLMAKSLVNMEATMSAMDAAKLMKLHRVGSVLVKRDNRIVGIVTEPDIIRKVIGAERVLCAGRGDHEQPCDRHRLAPTGYGGSRYD